MPVLTLRDETNPRGITPDAEAVRAHLANVLVSRQFSAAPRLSRFLSFVVEAALEGKSAEIKESLIAVEVYGRPADYDPQIDSTVRVEAWRLRAKLREFYERAGSSESLVIDLPKGKYIPVFREQPTACAAAPPAPVRQSPVWRYRGWIASLAILFLIGFVAALAGRTSEPPPPNSQALKTYSQAWELLRHNKSEDGSIIPVEESVHRAILLFEESLRHSPRYVRGWVSLAEANEFAYELDREHPAHFLSAARSAARRAIELDPRLPDAYTVLCSILFFRDWDLAGAEAACRRAVELNPRDVIAQRRLADLRRVEGRPAEAAAELDRAINLVPTDPGLRLRKARLFYDARQYEQAAEETRASLALNGSRQMPSWTLALWLQGLCREQLGQIREAEESYRLALTHDADDMWNESALGHLLGRTGRMAEAEAILRETERRVAQGEARHMALALVQLGLNRPSRALASLEQGFVKRDDSMLFLGLEQRFGAIHSHPRFQSLLGKLKERG